jgi:hypothetical protein
MYDKWQSLCGFIRYYIASNFALFKSSDEQQEKAFTDACENARAATLTPDLWAFSSNLMEGFSQ